MQQLRDAKRGVAHEMQQQTHTSHTSAMLSAVPGHPSSGLADSAMNGDWASRTAYFDTQLERANMLRILMLQIFLATIAPNVLAAGPAPGEVDGAKAATASINREQLASKLLAKWEPFILESGVASLDEWRAEMKALFDQADVANLELAGQRNVYAAMLKTVKGMPISDEAALSAVAERAETLGLNETQMKVLGDTDKDLIYVPVDACRIADTRLAGGVIAAGTTRHFDITAVASYSFQGGDASDCGGVGAAGSFAAAALRLTVLTPTAAGYITAFPYLATQPLTSTLNYDTDDIIISATSIVRLDQGASANEISVYTFAQTHLVIDIVGYFHNPGAMTLQCSNTGNNSLSIPAGGTGNVVAPACAAGLNQTATNCETSSWEMPLVFINAGTCSAQNNSASSATLRASRTCCRPINN